MQIPILYEDKYLMVVNKPQGMIVEEAQRGYENVMSILKKQFKMALRGSNNIIQNVHRIDKPVSGTLLLGRKASVVKLLNEQFATKQIGKKYLAIVSGSLQAPEGELNHWLIKDDENKKSIIHDRKVQLSAEVKLKYMVMAENDGKSLLQIELITGKYHQIRAQLAQVGKPIIGDQKYGSVEKYSPHAIALHASSLTFKHPIEGTIMTVSAPTPEDELWGLFK
jgi:RluA family pseudouridine synthase